MKKVLLIFLTIFCIEKTIITAQENESICTRLQSFLGGLLIAADFNIARITKGDNFVLQRAAELKDPSLIKYCLKKNIGDPLFENEEGHTALSIAHVCENKQHEELIKQSLSLYEKSPTSVAQRKKYE